MQKRGIATAALVSVVLILGYSISEAVSDQGRGKANLEKSISIPGQFPLQALKEAMNSASNESETVQTIIFQPDCASCSTLGAFSLTPSTDSHPIPILVLGTSQNHFKVQLKDLGAKTPIVITSEVKEFPLAFLMSGPIAISVDENGGVINSARLSHFANLTEVQTWGASND